MIKAGRGRIVNVSSVAGKEGNANLGCYSAVKAGVIALTKVLGKELATKGVLVNAITPTVTETELMHAVTPEMNEAFLAKIPMGPLLPARRSGRHDRVAPQRRRVLHHWFRLRSEWRTDNVLIATWRGASTCSSRIGRGG